jgi:hypothetical protein
VGKFQITRRFSQPPLDNFVDKPVNALYGLAKSLFLNGFLYAAYETGTIGM